MNVAVNKPLTRLPACAPLGTRNPALPQQALGLVQVTGGVLKGTLAVHDSGARVLAQALDVVH